MEKISELNAIEIHWNCLCGAYNHSHVWSFMSQPRIMIDPYCTTCKQPTFPLQEWGHILQRQGEVTP